MKIIVDTNIIFSVLLNSSNTIGDLVFNSDPFFEFYSCSYMQHEIQRHWEKLKAISKLTDEELQTSYHQVLLKIRFIDEELITKGAWLRAEQIVKEIDIDDIDFVALTKHLSGHLWTGDKPLYEGLKKTGFANILNTQELATLRKEKLKE